jgi:anti-sigma factor RsiW
MKCLDTETLCMHLDDELDTRTQRDVAEHLSGCRSCMDRLTRLRAHEALQRRALLRERSAPAQGHACYSAEELSAYASGQLTSQEAEPFERHLQGCDMCLREVMAIRRTMTLLRREPLLSPPANLVATADQRLASGEPTVAQAPRHWRAKVWSWIERQRARWRGFAWVPQLASPTWATALAMALVLSVSLNVWWGVRSFEQRPSDSHQAADTGLGDPSADGRLRTYRFQVGMARAPELAALVAAHSPQWEPTAIIGFTPQAARTAFFRMGTLYAEALAALNGDAVEAASQRLDVLVQALASVQAPRPLSEYLREQQSLLQSRRYDSAVAARFLALFEPLYEDAYGRAETAERVTLFRAGTWVENMYLAAAAGDAAAVRRGGQAVDDVRRALAQLQAPREALAVLEQLQPLVARQTLTERDLSTIRTLVQNLQAMLSE